MHTLSSLAPELLLEIADYLLLPDLHSFVHTRLCFSRTLQPPFRYHHALKQRYRALDGPPDDEPLGWMGVLLKVLRGELPASYIEEVKINTVEWYWNELKAWRAGTQLNAADYRLVETQARRSPWIHESDACGPLAKARSMQEFLLEVREGDQDNILAILLPLLPNLHTLTVPPTTVDNDSLGSVPGVVSRIAIAASNSPSSSRSSLPFQHLHEIRGQPVEVGHDNMGPVLRGPPLNTYPPYLSIPSVRVLVGSHTLEDPFEWPAELPKSQVRHINLVETQIDFADVKALLAEGLAHPCSITQSTSVMNNLLIGLSGTWSQVIGPFDEDEGGEGCDPPWAKWTIYDFDARRYVTQHNTRGYD